MAAKPKTRAGTAKKKAAPASESSQSIAEQTQAFLKSGGKIDYVNSGVSGQQSMAGPKYIALGNKTQSK
jgi:hypothetical protein